MGITTSAFGSQEYHMAVATWRSRLCQAYGPEVADEFCKRVQLAHSTAEAKAALDGVLNKTSKSESRWQLID